MINKHPEYQKLINKHFPSSEFTLDIEIMKDPPKEYIEKFFLTLKGKDNYDEIKNDFLYDEELNVFIQVHNRFPQREVFDLTEEEIFFYPFMDKKEIKQIFNIKSSTDYLLRLRAEQVEQVEQDARLKRTFSKLKKKLGDRWSFTHYCDSKQYSQYLKKLKPIRRKLCSGIPHGTIHSSEANGMCLKTPFGNIIVLSYTLRQFLFYMNIFHFGRQLKIKEIDVIHSFILAIRIMIGTESLDFEIDNRGRLPKSIKRHIDFLTDWQMSFIIGHEYAHHYLGHLRRKSIIKSNDRVSDLNTKFQHYTYRQKNEFEADLHSITETNHSRSQKTDLLDGAFLFFTYLDTYYQVEDYIFPKTRQSITHPKPKDRIWKLREGIKEDIGLTKENLQSIIKFNDSFMEDFMQNYLPYNIEKIEINGSIYLPSYKKKRLIDRIDF